MMMMMSDCLDGQPDVNDLEERVQNERLDSFDYGQPSHICH